MEHRLWQLFCHWTDFPFAFNMVQRVFLSLFLEMELESAFSVGKLFCVQSVLQHFIFLIRIENVHGLAQATENLLWESVGIYRTY